MYLGAFVRDFGWIRMLKKRWAFTEKVVYWKKVEAIAAGDAEGV